MGLSSRGGPGSRARAPRGGKDELAGRAAVRIGQGFGAFNQKCLAQIVLRHGPVELAEALDENGFLLGGVFEFSTESGGGGIARDVVFGRAEAADEDDDVGAIEGMTDGVGETFAIVANHLLGEDFHTEQVEALGDGERIGIDTLRGE